MSGLKSDQLHRSTLRIYTTLMDQFNPSLQRLVALGNNYIQAFQALAATSEAYFSALAKIGEQAMQTVSSRLLGSQSMNPVAHPPAKTSPAMSSAGARSDILIQISESQRRLTSELEGVFRWFHNEVFQEMENNVRMDKDYISGSRRRYEMEVRNHAITLERQLRRGGSQDAGEYVQFLRESQREALKEEERRYRFLAEKHCGLTQSIVYLMNKTGGSLQQKAEGWREQVNQTRMSRPRTPSRVEDDMVDNQAHALAEQPLGRVPSRGPSPQPTHSRSSSFGESLGLAGGRMMQAKVAHPPSYNKTLLSFARGEIVTVLVSEPRNGWLYGRSESSSRQGWFPAAYIGPIEDTPRPPDSSNSSLRSSSSMNNLLEYSTISKNTAAPAPPAPPPPSQMKSSTAPITTIPTESKRQEDYMPRPELFPRGTNPFATVKLKPTTTNDRSAPRIF